MLDRLVDDTPVHLAEDDLSHLPVTRGRVTATRRITCGLVELTVGGVGDLGLVGGDEFVYVLVSDDPSGPPPGYTMADLRRRDPDDPVRGAYYTVRRSRPALGEVDLWVVDHGHRGSVGDRLVGASAGTPIAMWGPRTGFRHPPTSHHTLLVADETGWAAVAALLDHLRDHLPDHLPDRRRVTVVLEGSGTDPRLVAHGHPSVEVVHVDRGDAPAGVGSMLLSAVEALSARWSSSATPIPDAVFGAGESTHATAVRRFVRHGLGVPARRVLVTGYWRLGDAS